MSEAEWIELFPHGLSAASGLTRPVLILKDQHHAEVLPVWMHPLDAGVAMAEMTQGSGASPHAVSRKILEALRLAVVKCRFVELVGHHQYVELELSGRRRLKVLRLRADEAMSFCLQAKVQFFSTRSFMARCRDLDMELNQLEQGLAHGTLAGLRAEMEINSKKHPYVM